MNPVKLTPRLCASVLASLSAALLLGTAAQAQSAQSAQPVPGYPSKPVRMIVPFPAGGTTDVVARLVSKGVTTAWGQPVVIDNKGGASGMIGSAEGARAAPDGYTLTMGNSQTHSANAALFSKPQFDMVNGVAPIATLTYTKHVLVVRADSPYKTYQDLVAKGKASQLSYGTPSVGSSSHIVSESMRRATGINAVAVPYRGAAPMMQDLLGGQIDYTMGSYGSTATFLREGRLRALAVSGDKRDADLPNVPSFAELGLKGLSLEPWIGLYAPANTPAPILKAWSDAVSAILADPDNVKTLKSAGFDVRFRSAEEMKTFHPEEVKRWAREVKASKITLD